MSEDINRQKRIEEKLRAEDALEEHDAGAIKRAMLEFLTANKGYLPEEIEVDREFQVITDNCQGTASTDFIINLNNKRFMAIKCAASAIESRVRHILALSRVVDSYQIPLAVVTDGTEARVMDTVSGRVVSEDINSIPSRAEALDRIREAGFAKCPAERIEKEKRILLAFESISCPAYKP